MSQKVVGITWGLGMNYGWGLHGYHLTKRIQERRIARVLAYGPINLTPSEFENLGAIRREGMVSYTVQPDLKIYAGGNETPQSAARRDVCISVFEQDPNPKVIETLKRMAQVITVSDWNAERLRQLGVASAVCAPLGVDCEFFSPMKIAAETDAPIPPERKDKRFRVFSGGKVEYRKGQDIVLAAFKVLEQRHPGEVCLVTNWMNMWTEHAKTINQTKLLDKPLETEGLPFITNREIDTWAKANGISSHYDIGVAGRQMIRNTLWSCDCAIFPNRVEGGTNMVMMEALASGLPCIIAEGHGHDDVLRVLRERSKQPLCLTVPDEGVVKLSWVLDQYVDLLDQSFHAFRGKWQHRDKLLEAMQPYNWKDRMDFQIWAMRLEELLSR